MVIWRLIRLADCHCNFVGDLEMAWNRMGRDVKFWGGIFGIVSEYSMAWV